MEPSTLTHEDCSSSVIFAFHWYFETEFRTPEYDVHFKKQSGRNTFMSINNFFHSCQTVLFSLAVAKSSEFAEQFRLVFSRDSRPLIPDPDFGHVSSLYRSVFLK